MTLPNFLVIGAAKGGTTAFTKFLQAHPQAHMPFKEPNFFSGWETRVTFDGPLRDLERADRFCGLEHLIPTARGLIPQPGTS